MAAIFVQLVFVHSRNQGRDIDGSSACSTAFFAVCSRFHGELCFAAQFFLRWGSPYLHSTKNSTICPTASLFGQVGLIPRVDGFAF